MRSSNFLIESACLVIFHFFFEASTQRTTNKHKKIVNVDKTKSEMLTQFQDPGVLKIHNEPTKQNNPPIETVNTLSTIVIAEIVSGETSLFLKETCLPMEWPKKDPRNKEPIKLDNELLTKIQNASCFPKKLKILCSLMLTKNIFSKNKATITRNILGLTVEIASLNPSISTEVNRNAKAKLVKIRGSNVRNLFLKTKVKTSFKN